MSEVKKSLLRYHPFSFKDSDNERVISRQDMVSLLNSNATKGSCVSEQIYDQESIRPYFDIDLYGHSSDMETITLTIEKYQNSIRELFAAIYKYKIFIAVSFVHKQTTEGDKLSMHCIVTNVHMTIDGLHDFVRDNNELLETLSFDCGVYKKRLRRQKFRCVNTCKENEGIECLLKPFTFKDDLEKHLIQCDTETCDFINYNTTRICIEDTNDNSKAKFSEQIPITNRKLQRRILNHLKTLTLAKILNTNDSWFQWRKMITSIVLAGGSRKAARDYSMLSSKHDDNVFDTLYDEVVARDYKKHHFALIACLRRHLPKLMYLYSADDVRDTETVQSFYDDMHEHDFIAVRATYGCGKTYHGIRPALEKFVKMNKSVIIPTEKRSLSGHFHRTLADLGFVKYNEIKDDNINAKKYPFLIIQLDSLHRVQSDYDVVILDETCSLNTAFSNPSMPRRSRVIGRFVSLVKNAEKIAICDADLNDEVIMEYEEISGKTFYCIDYTYRKLSDRSCYIRTDEELHLSAMHTDMMKGFPIAYTSQSVKACKRAFLYAKETIPHKKLVLIMGDECELIGYPPTYPANMKQRKEYVLANLTEFEDCDFFASTPAITSGVSFNSPDHFHTVYAYCTNKSNSYRSFVQQLNRIRNIKTNMYDIFIGKNVLSLNSCVPFTLSECISTIEHNRLVSFGKLKKTDVDKIEDLLNTCIPEMHENRNVYAPIVKWLAAITLRETLDTRYRYFNALRTVLEFHGIECFVDTDGIDPEEDRIIPKLNEKVDSNDVVIIQKVVDSDDITEQIYTQNQECMTLDDERSFEVHKYRVKQLFRIDSETPIHPFHVKDYNNASHRWKIRRQLEIYDLLNECKGDTNIVMQHLQQKHETHVKYVCSDLYNEFNDSDTGIWKLFSYDILNTLGFEGPYDFNSVLDKQEVRDKFDTHCNRLYEDYYHLILGKDIEMPCKEWSNHNMLSWVNYVLNKTYGIHIALANQKTRIGRECLVLYSEVATPFHFIPNAYESFGFTRDIETFEAEQQTNLQGYIDTMFPSQPIKTVVDIDTWLTNHVVAGSGCATSKDIYDSLLCSGLQYTRNEVYDKIKELFNTSFRENSRVNGKCVRKVVMNHIIDV